MTINLKDLRYAKEHYKDLNLHQALIRLREANYDAKIYAEVTLHNTMIFDAVMLSLLEKIKPDTDYTKLKAILMEFR